MLCSAVNTSNCVYTKWNALRYAYHDDLSNEVNRYVYAITNVAHNSLFMVSCGGERMVNFTYIPQVYFVGIEAVS